MATGTIKNSNIKSMILSSATSDANGFINFTLPTTKTLISANVTGYPMFTFRRSDGYWYGIITNGSLTIQKNTTFNNIQVLYID